MKFKYFCFLICLSVFMRSTVSASLNLTDPGIIDLYLFNEERSGNIYNSQINGEPEFYDTSVTAHGDNHEDFGDGISNGPQWELTTDTGDGISLGFERSDNDRTRCSSRWSDSQGNYTDGASQTYMIRIKPQPFTSSQIYQLLGFAGTSSYLSLEGLPNGNARLNLKLTSGPPGYIVWYPDTSGLEVEPDQWVNVFVIIDTNTASPKITVALDDGTVMVWNVDTSVPSGWSPADYGYAGSANTLYIAALGATGYDGMQFDGLVDCLIRWDKPLSLSEADDIDLGSPVASEPYTSDMHIQAAVNAKCAHGGTVSIPSGTTLVQQSIMICDNISLVGQGPGSILQAETSLGMPVLKNISSSGNEGLRFTGFKIAGNVSVENTPGIQLTSCNNVIIEDMDIYDCSDAIELKQNCSEIIIKNCKLHDNGFEGIFVHSGCGIKGDAEGGDLQNIIVTGCDIESNFFNGIHFRYASNLRFYDNYIFDHDQDPNISLSGDDPIKLYLCSEIIAVGNRLDEGKNSGIEFWHSGENIAIGNYVTQIDDGPEGNGCIFSFGGSQGLWASKYLWMANIARATDYGFTFENNEAPEGIPQGIVSINYGVGNFERSLHFVHCNNMVSAYNISRNNGTWDPPNEGLELGGVIYSGQSSYNNNFHGNLIFDDRQDRDQMYGLLLRYALTSSVSDNIITGSEILDLSIEPGGTTVQLNDNLYYNPVIRFIVSDIVSPGGGDPEIKNQLEYLGYTVNYYDDDAPHPGNLTEDMILISETVSATPIGGNYKTEDVPVMFMHPAMAYYMEIADLGYNYSSQQYIKIIDIDNYVTSNLARDGFLQVTATSSRFSTIGGNIIGTVLAEKYDNSSQAVIVAVESGTADQIGYAVPQRRLFMYVAEQTYGNLNSTGANLFQRAVEWTLGAE